MYITITLSKEWLRRIRKLLIFIHAKRALVWWRELESKHWRTRGLVKGRTRSMGMPDFTIDILPRYRFNLWVNRLSAWWWRMCHPGLENKEFDSLFEAD